MFLLAMLIGERLPPRKPNDRVDLVCTWIFQIALVIFCVAVSELVCAEEIVENSQHAATDLFFHQCSSGELSKVQAALESNPDWITLTTPNGEHCLHLAGIFGAADVTELLLQKGADPNIRSTFSEGLRMHPLSWNVYGGHVDNIKMLLKYGADVNLDFDAMNRQQKVTAMDIALQLVQNESDDVRFQTIVQVLQDAGAKPYAAIVAGEKSASDAEPEL